MESHAEAEGGRLHMSTAHASAPGLPAVARAASWPVHAGQNRLALGVRDEPLAGYAALAGIPVYPGTVTAVEDTHLFSWSTHTIRELMGKHAQIAINALAVLGTRYQETQTRLRELSTETVERRIAHTLMRLAKQAGRRTAQGIEICFPLSRQDFAELAGTTLHTVSRTLSAWEKDGIVSSTHRYIVIHQPEFLEQLREDTP